LIERPAAQPIALNRLSSLWHTLSHHSEAASSNFPRFNLDNIEVDMYQCT